MRRVEQLCFWRFLVLAAGAVIAAYTLAPFEIHFSGVRERIAEAKSWTAAEGWGRTSCHVLVFLWFGFCLGKQSATRHKGVFALFLFSVLIEIAQLLIFDRHARLPDWIINFSAGIAGFWFSRKIEVFETQNARAGVLKCVLGGTAIVWFGASAVPCFRLSLASWDAGSRIVVGNELDGTEPWHGRISRIELSALDLPVLRQNADTSWVSYEFAETAKVEAEGRLSERVGLVPKIDIKPYPPWISEGTAERLCDQVLKSGSFKLIAQVGAPEFATNVAGRLISLSSSAIARNFMLGREGKDIVFRVRNGVMEENGRRNILIARDVLAKRPLSLTALYDHGFAALYEGRTVIEQIDLRQPSVYLRLGAGSGSATAAGALLGVFVAFPLYCLLPIRNLVLAATLAVAAAVSLEVLPFWVVCSTLGGPINLSFIGMTSVAIGLAYLVAHFFCSHKVNALLQSGSSGSRFPR